MDDVHELHAQMARDGHDSVVEYQVRLQESSFQNPDVLQSTSTVNGTLHRAKSFVADKRWGLTEAGFLIVQGLIMITFGALSITQAMGPETIGIALVTLGSFAIAAVILLVECAHIRACLRNDTQVSRPDHGNLTPPPGYDHEAFNTASVSAYPTSSPPNPSHGSVYPQVELSLPSYSDTQAQLHAASSVEDQMSKFNSSGDSQQF